MWFACQSRFVFQLFFKNEVFIFYKINKKYQSSSDCKMFKYTVLDFIYEGNFLCRKN